MEIRQGDLTPSLAAHSYAPRLPIFYFLFSIFILYGCAAPGEPIERKPPTPTPVTDLTASQSGNDVVLTFTLPRDSVEKREILKPISVNVYRDFEPIPPSQFAGSRGARKPHSASHNSARHGGSLHSPRASSIRRFASRWKTSRPTAARLSTSFARLSRLKNFPRIPTLRLSPHIRPPTRSPTSKRNFGAQALLSPGRRPKKL